MKKGESVYIFKPSDLDVGGSLSIIVKDCGELLEKHYPGWQWLINPDPFAGMIYIYSLMLSGEWGYKLRIADIQNDPKRKEAVRAGGEILARFGLPRGKYHRDPLKGKMVDLMGNYIPDITDSSAKAQKQKRDRDLTKAIDEGKAAIVHKDTVQEDGTVFRQIAIRIGEEDGGLDSTGQG